MDSNPRTYQGSLEEAGWALNIDCAKSTCRLTGSANIYCIVIHIPPVYSLLFSWGSTLLDKLIGPHYYSPFGQELSAVLF